MEEPNKEFYPLDQEEIMEFIYERLVDLGYVPSEDETWDIADIFLDFLFSLGVITDVIQMDDDEDIDKYLDLE